MPKHKMFCPKADERIIVTLNPPSVRAMTILDFNSGLYQHPAFKPREGGYREEVSGHRRAIADIWRDIQHDLTGIALVIKNVPDAFIAIECLVKSVDGDDVMTRELLCQLNDVAWSLPTLSITARVCSPNDVPKDISDFL